jgi:putative membrane protein
VYQIELPKTIARKEILQAQYKIMTAFGTLSHGLLLYKCFCVLDAVFTDLGKAWLQMPWMHVNLALYLHCI